MKCKKIEIVFFCYSYNPKSGHPSETTFNQIGCLWEKYYFFVLQKIVVIIYCLENIAFLSFCDDTRKIVKERNRLFFFDKKNSGNK